MDTAVIVAWTFIAWVTPNWSNHGPVVVPGITDKKSCIALVDEYRRVNPDVHDIAFCVPTYINAAQQDIDVKVEK